MWTPSVPGPRNGLFTAERLGEVVDHAGVGVGVVDGVGVDVNALAAEDDVDGVVDGHAVFGDEDAVAADDLDDGAVLRAGGDVDAGEDVIGELELDRGGGFDGAGVGVLRGDGGDAGCVHVAKDEAEGVDAVDADVADGAAGGEGGVGDPGAAGELRGVVELGVRGAGFADLAGGDAGADLLDGVRPAVVMRDSEELAGGVGGGEHGVRISSVGGEGFFAEDGLLEGEGELCVGQMERVWAGDEDGVDVG